MEQMHSFELGLIHQLQSLHGPFLDGFFITLNFFDTELFFFLLIPFVWYFFRWKWGARLAYAVILSAFINAWIKGLFMQPRPFQLVPEYGLIQVSGYSFPSGGAQNSVLFPGLLTLAWKSPWRWLVAILITLFIGFSRVYLGVHFPSDVLVGWILGAILLVLFTQLGPRIEQFLKNQSYSSQLALTMAATSFLLLAYPSGGSIRSGACFLGVSIGLITSDYFHLLKNNPKESLFIRLSRLSLGLAGFLGLYWFLQVGKTSLAETNFLGFFLFLSYFLTGFWISYGTEQVFQKLRRLG